MVAMTGPDTKSSAYTEATRTWGLVYGEKQSQEGCVLGQLQALDPLRAVTFTCNARLCNLPT